MRTFQYFIAGFFLFTTVHSDISAQGDGEPRTAVDRSGAEMILVPAGDFELGVNTEALIPVCEAYGEWSGINVDRCIRSLDDDPNPPAQQMHLESFWIDRFEVTNEIYQKCVDDGRCDVIYLPENHAEHENNHPQKPIVGVNWYQASQLCTWRQARLPTNAEWEYAASGPDNNLLPWGGLVVDEHAINSLETYIVGTNDGDVSWIGVHDLTFNAREWVEDRYVPYESFIEEHISRSDADVRRTLRGAAWNTSIAPDGYTYHRWPSDPMTSNGGVGVRCARFTDPSR